MVNTVCSTGKQSFQMLIQIHLQISIWQLPRWHFLSLLSVHSSNLYHLLQPIITFKAFSIHTLMQSNLDIFTKVTNIKLFYIIRCNITCCSVYSTSPDKYCLDEYFVPCYYNCATSSPINVSTQEHDWNKPAAYCLYTSNYFGIDAFSRTIIIIQLDLPRPHLAICITCQEPTLPSLSLAKTPLGYLSINIY